jgi:hypothetical protein
MPTTIPLHDLAHRIKQQEMELEGLRKEHDKRQDQLKQLAKQKAELQAQLAKIDAEIAVVGPMGGASAGPALKIASTPDAVPLPQYLVQLVRDANGPITMKGLADEVERSGFPTTSKNVQSLVMTRVYDLLRKGILARAADERSIVLGKGMAESAPPTKAAKKAPSPKPAAKASDGKKMTLHDALTQVLGKTTRPLSTQELADGALRVGYQTRSKDLKNVIWVGIGKMDNIERVSDGYRLKKGK